MGQRTEGMRLILAVPFHHFHVLRQLRPATRSRTPSTPVACPRGPVPQGLVVLQGSVANPSGLDGLSPARVLGVMGKFNRVATTCGLKKSLKQVRNSSAEVLCLPNHLWGKRKGKAIKMEGRKHGEKWSSVMMEVSSSWGKRGKKAGKTPGRGFGDMRKVVLGMDVH